MRSNDCPDRSNRPEPMSTFFRTTRLIATSCLFGLPCTLAHAQDGSATPGSDRGESIEAEAVESVQDAAQDVPSSKINAKDVEARLKMRTPKFRKVKIFDPATQPQPQPVTPTDAPGDAGKGKPTARLFGDAEKQDLAEGVVVTVDGQQISESEVMDLAKYLASYQGGTPDTYVSTALDQLITIRAIEAGLGSEKIASLRKQIGEWQAAAAKPDADFAAIAKEHSECPSSAQGGDLGQFGRQSMVVPFAQQAFSLPVGQVSPVFATNFGYHFLKVTGKQKGATPAEDQVRASHVLLMFDKNQAKANEFTTRLMSGKADVAVRDDEWRQKLPPYLR
ncbi:MAG: peptidylprolyl isomerase [Planctomycetes bacterium]|nr:peptidylprolyl isomerase [Planctomycetota bacterium]MCB9917177.1 peptidylprolyl isomerase [Planctomycetota bacterium]